MPPLHQDRVGLSALVHHRIFFCSDRAGVSALIHHRLLLCFQPGCCLASHIGRLHHLACRVFYLLALVTQCSMTIAPHIAHVYEPYWSMQALLDMSLCVMDSFGALQYGSCTVPTVANSVQHEAQECALFWGVWWGALLLVRL